jgi:peptide/nickel transport system substrate-binding protein
MARFGRAMVVSSIAVLVLTLVIPYSPGVSAAKSAQELRAGIEYTIDTMDPALIISRGQDQTVRNIYDGLVNWKPGTVEVAPALAESWEISGDGLTYTFHLRKGVQFHRGFGELKASDVKFSFERVKDPATKSPSSKDFSLVKEMEALDDYTFRLKLTQPVPGLLHILADRGAFVTSEKAVKELGKDLGRAPVGTGPFFVTKWVPKQNVVLERNESYFAGPPRLSKATLIYIPEEATRFMAFDSGQIDLFQVADPDRVDKYLKDPKAVVKGNTGLICRYIGFNKKIKPFDDVRVRRAIQHAVDKDYIVNYLFKGLSEKSVNLVPPPNFGYTADVMTYPYDEQKAKKLLAEAGYPNGFKTTLYIPNIGRFTKHSVVVKEMLAKVGVDLELKVMDVSVFLDACRRGEPPMYTLSTSGSPDTAYYLYRYLHSKNFPPGTNYGYYSNPEVDALIDKAQMTVDPQKQKAMLVKIQKKVAEDSADLYLDHEKFFFVMKPNVKGFEVDPLRLIKLHTTYLQD